MEIDDGRFLTAEAYIRCDNKGTGYSATFRAGMKLTRCTSLGDDVGCIADDGS